MAQELTVNALAAIVRAGWVVTIDVFGIYYSRNGMNYPGDWIRIPDEVVAAMGVAGIEPATSTV